MTLKKECLPRCRVPYSPRTPKCSGRKYHHYRRLLNTGWACTI